MRGTWIIGCVAATPVWADVPAVAVDIAPVHALVAQVMGDLGRPALILPPGASPHTYAMRPSEAAALEDADLFVWIGESLTPGLERPVETLASGAVMVQLLSQAPVQLEFREGVAFEPHDHGEDHDDHGHEDHDDHAHEDDDHAHEDDDHAHEDDDHAHEDDDHGHEGDDHAHEGDDHAHEDDDHAHEEHDDHAHEDDDAHDDHADAHDHDHDHSGIDPHAWLDPQNAIGWLALIADALAEADPENAAIYQANAATAQADLQALEAEISDTLSGVEGRFVVFHDAYHYFEARFGIEASGAISLSDAAPPSPARMAGIRELVVDNEITCVFTEPQFNRGVVDSVFGETDVRIGVLDPIGATLEPGPDHYTAVLRSMANAFAECLAP